MFIPQYLYICDIFARDKFVQIQFFVPYTVLDSLIHSGDYGQPLSLNVISNTKNTLAGQMNELATLWALDKNTPTTNIFFKGIWKINENNAGMIVE